MYYTTVFCSLILRTNNMFRSLFLLLFVFAYFFELSGESTPQISENSVDVITGMYVESNQDIMVPGPMPFVVKREFGSDGYHLAEGWSWKIEATTDINPYDSNRLHLVPKLSDDQQLLRIQAQGARNNQILSWIRFHRLSRELELTTHDGQLWKLEFDGNQLKKVTAPGHESISYDYEGHQISRRETSQGHYLVNEFYQLGVNEVGSEVVEITDPQDPRIGKVKLQKSIISKDSDPLVIARYFYRDNKTEVIDVRGARKVYRYQDDHITEVDTFDEKEWIRKEQFSWDDKLLSSQSVFDGSGQLIKETTYEYDECGRKMKDTLSGNLRSQGYESYSHYKEFLEDGNLAKEWEDNGRYVEYQYDPESKLVKLAESGSSGEIFYRTEFEYDDLGILISTSQYDLKKDRVKDTLITPSDDPHSAGLPMMIEEVSWDEDSEEKLQKTILNSFTMRGKVREQTIIDNDSQNKRVVRKEFDDFGREIYACDSSGDESLTVYHPQLSSVTRTNLTTKEITESHYNFQKRVTHRKVSKNDGTVLEQTNQYDDKGNLVVSQDVLGNETTYRYDILGRLIEKRDPKVLDSDENEYHPINLYQYDSLNQLISHTDPNGAVTKFSYTVRGKPYRILYADQSTDEFDYNLDGTLRSHKARDGLTIHYERDCYGRITDTYINEKKEVKPSKTKHVSKPIPQDESVEIEEHLEYTHINERGQRALQKFLVQEDGTTVISTFDALGRIEKMELLNPMGSLVSKKVCRYDGAGQLTVQRDFVIENGNICGEIETRWKYEPGGQIKEKIEFSNTSSPRTIRYIYNSQRRLEKVIKADGTELNYQYHFSGDLYRLTSSDLKVNYEYLYDDQHNVVQVIDHSTSHTVYREYDENNQIVREVLGNGLELINTYDDHGRRNSLVLPDGSGALYNYDEDHLRAVHRTDISGQIQYTHKYNRYDEDFLVESQMIGNLGKIKIQRDKNHQITSINTHYWSQKSLFSHQKISHITTYDQKGTTKNSTSINDLGQLTQDGNDSYQYDSVDNMLSQNQKSYQINELNQVTHFDGADYQYDKNGNLISKNNHGKLTTFEYDALDRLVSVKTDKKTVNYTYDAFHRRISKQIVNEAPIYYLLDGDNEIGTTDVSGNLKEFRLLGLGHGAEIGAAILLEIEGKIYAPIHDHRGSVVTIVDIETQKPVEIYRYSAFGSEEIFDEKGQAIEKSLNPWRFSSKRYEEESQLIHYGKREYDPQLCRWTSQDPLGFFDGVNRYAFVGNNPLQMVDLHGLFSISYLWEGIHSAVMYINKKVCERWTHCAETYQIVDTTYQLANEIGNHFIGPNYMIFSGFHTSESHTGVYGGGFEPHEKYRITFVNGILTTKEHLNGNLQIISESHGGCNVHYCYVGTNGWTNDLIRSLFTKIGVINPETKELAKIWRRLINDMGGVNSGGIIFHYAHSLGGTETLLAKYLVTPEELKMIRVITMGSPTLIPDDGFHSVVNIISCRDIIAIFDPIRFIYAMMYDTNSFFVGSLWDGWPVVDHPFYCYWTYLQAHFWEEFEDLLDDML